MSRRNGKPIQINTLKPSTKDDVCLAREIEKNFLLICQLYATVHGENIPIPQDLDKDMYLWRRMRVRHKARDYRHTDDEIKACRVIAQWTVDMNHRLRGQEGEPPKIVWGV